MDTMSVYQSFSLKTCVTTLLKTKIRLLHHTRSHNQCKTKTPSTLIRINLNTRSPLVCREKTHMGHLFQLLTYSQNQLLKDMLIQHTLYTKPKYVFVQTFWLTETTPLNLGSNILVRLPNYALRRFSIFYVVCTVAKVFYLYVLCMDDVHLLLSLFFVSTSCAHRIFVCNFSIQLQMASNFVT